MTVRALYFRHFIRSLYTNSSNRYSKKSCRSIRSPFPDEVSHYLYRARLIDSIRLNLRSSSPTPLLSIVNTPNLDSFVVANAIRSAPSTESALALVETLQQVPHFSHTQNTICALAKVLARGRRVDELKSLINDVDEGKFWNVRISYMDQMQWFAVAADLDSVLQVWDTYRASSEHVCTESFNIVMSLYAERCMDSEAVESFRKMIDVGAVPNCRTYTIVIEHLMRRGKLDEAMEVFGSLPVMRVKRTLRQYSVLVDGFVKAERFNIVKDILDEMRTDGLLPGRDMLASLKQMQNAGFVEIDNLTEEMIPDYRIKNVAYSVDGSDEDEDEGEKEEEDEDKQVLSDVHNGGVVKLKPWLDPQALASALRRWGHGEITALEKAKFIWTTRLVCKLLRNFKSAKTAWSFFCWVGHQPEFIHDLYTVQRMLTILARHGDAELVEELLLKTQREGIRLPSSTIKLIIEFYGISKNADAAMRVFRDVKALCSPVSQFNMMILYASLLRTLTKCGKSADSINILEEMILCGINPDIQTYSGLMHYFAHEEDLRTVQKLFSMVRQSGLEPDAFMFKVLVTAYCKCERAALAWKSFEDMRNYGMLPDTETKKLLIKGLWKEGMRREAASVEETSEELNAVVPRAIGGHIWTVSSADLTKILTIYSSCCLPRDDRLGNPPQVALLDNASNNPFAPKPFGSSSPFGAHTGGSIFGSNSTGVFGATQASSPLGSTTAFGASSTPAFGAASAPAFGASSSSAFGGSSAFGQKPAFGGFGSTPTQSSPFGFQASQPAFGSSVFGSSTGFGAPSQPAFGASSTPAFAASNTSAFGATNTPAFGSTASPGFGASSPSIFGSSSTPAFGASSTPAFGASSTPAFGASSAPAFGSSSTPSFSFGASPAFGQSTSAFGSSPFGAAPSAFGSQSSPFGTQATTPTFGNANFGQQQAFGGQRGGSRVASYTPTTETDVAAGAQAGKLESISAMPVYKDKSHEELRWEDYQLGDKGGPNPAGQSQTAGAGGFGTSTNSSNPFAASSPFGQTSSNPFSTPVASNPFSTPSSTNPFAAKSQPFGTSGFGTSTTTAFNSSPFGVSSTTNAFGVTSSTSPSIFGSSTPAFGVNTSTSVFGVPTSSAFGSSPSLFGSASGQGSSPAFGVGFGNTQSSPLLQSNAASIGQTSAFGQTNSAFGQNSSPFGQTSNSPFGQTNVFSTPSSGFGGNLFSNTPSPFGQTTSSLSTPFQSAQAASLGFGNLNQTQIATSVFGGTSNLIGQSTFGQMPADQSLAVPQPAPVTNPFGTLPAMPQISIDRTGASPSVQYGISSMPVVEKPAPIRVSSLLTSRHLSHRRLRLPARNYHPQNEASKVAFFDNDEETPSTLKADALFVPRENPRALVIQPMENRSLRGHSEKASPLKEKDSTGHIGENGGNNGHIPERADAVKTGPKSNGIHFDNLTTVNGESHKSLSGQRGEPAVVYEHGAGVEASIPKLHSPDWYTVPSLQELAAKERAEQGFCSRVNDFIIGRRGYGSIKFLGETDVRGLDLELLVQFNNREVIVYMDESRKPPVGQGLNKAAEVTLLNIRCIDKKTGRPFTEGPNVEKYKEMLKKKASDQGAEFMCYNPVDGEWVFRVSHFSSYRLGDEDEADGCCV